MRSRFAIIPAWTGAAVLLAAAELSAGQARPPVGPQPNPNPNPNPAAPKPLRRPSNRTLGQYMADFQSDDLAKRKAAAQEFLKVGGMVQHLLISLQRSRKPGVAELAQQVRVEIETRAEKMYKEARKDYTQVYRGKLDLEKLQALYRKFADLSRYAVKSAHKTGAASLANRIRRDLQHATQALKNLERLDKNLQADPPPAGVARAAIQDVRAASLATLRRLPEALEAAKDGLAACDRNKRLLPRLLARLAGLQERTRDVEGFLATCDRLLKECPRSLETREIHQMRIQFFEQENRFAEVVQAIQAYLAAFPVDDAADDLAHQELDLLFEIEMEYEQAAQLAEHLVKTLPVSRIRHSVPYYLALIDEFIRGDYAKAGKTWALLLEIYPDHEEADLVKAAIARVGQKAAGTFAAAPKPDDPGPAGALARFHAALKKKDLKAVQALTPKADAGAWLNRMDDVVPEIAFVDLSVEKTDIDEKAGKAVLKVKLIQPEREEPFVEDIQAVKEDGAWKIVWPAEIGTAAKPAAKGADQFIKPSTPPAPPKPVPPPAPPGPHNAPQKPAPPPKGVPFESKKEK